MKIITGKTATEHVNSEDDRGLYAGIFGSGSYILNTGTKFQTSIESSTTIRINSGDLVHQGCHARIPYDEYDEVTIDAGTTGYKRIDLIVARYERNAGLESMTLVAIKGQPAVSDPVAPDYNNGNILEGANISDMPLYRVMLDGVNIESVSNMATLYTIGSYIYPVGSIYISVNEMNPETLFGGVWERIQGKFLLSSSDSHALNTTGGQESISYTPDGTTEEHKITLDELPAHAHQIIEGNAHAFVDDGELSQTGILVKKGYSEYDVDATGASSKVRIANYTESVGDLAVNGWTASAGKTPSQQDAHNHTFTGTTTSLDTMPPYLTVNMWKRIA